MSKEIKQSVTDVGILLQVSHTWRIELVRISPDAKTAHLFVTKPDGTGMYLDLDVLNTYTIEYHKDILIRNLPKIEEGNEYGQTS